MFGHLLLVIKEGVLKNFGNDKWEEIKKKCGIKEEITEEGSYEMSLFDNMMKTSTKICGINETDFQRILGEAYLSKIQADGNNQLLRLLGKNLLEFLQNLDFIHTLALGKYPNADIPFFKVDTDTYGPNYIRLHYYSRRKNLSPMLESLLEAISKIFFKKTLKIRILEEGPQDNLYHILYSMDILNLSDVSDASDAPPTLIAQTKKNAEQQIEEKDINDQKEKIDFIRREYGEAALPVARARIAKNRWKTAVKMNILYSRLAPTIPKTLSISPKDFCESFPYHIIFDKSMLLKQAGTQIQAIIPDFRKLETNITKHLELVHPKDNSFTFENIESLLCCPHVVRTLNNNLVVSSNKKGQFHLRGEMIKLNESQLMLYLCSPMVSSLNDVDINGMHLSEIPNHDVTKYFCSFKTIKDDDWSDQFLGKDSANPNENNETVVISKPVYGGHSMISGKLANIPKDGKKYKNCSLLFCDIVHFSSIVSACGPVEIIELLNQLHDEFDKLSLVHDVQKIEAVGDAYLVLSGIPEQSSRRAERIANMALAMMIVSKTVHCPYDFGSPYGKRALIRIGLHCGDVIGGILGSTVPKFTIIGDSVVTASKMESHGLPDKIQLSAAIYKELLGNHYEITERGCIDVRGKGRQFTYFLNRHKDLSENALLGKTKEKIY